MKPPQLWLLPVLFPILLVFVDLCSIGLRAQSPVAQSRVPQWQIDAGGSADFDAESVRLDRSGGGGRNNLALAGGHLAMKSVSLRQLLAQAYKFASLSDAVNMIVGMPDWANSERFDIDAEADGDPSTDQKRLMLQSLRGGSNWLCITKNANSRFTFYWSRSRENLGPKSIRTQTHLAVKI
jgi:hypothetical protein